MKEHHVDNKEVLLEQLRSLSPEQRSMTLTLMLKALTTKKHTATAEVLAHLPLQVPLSIFSQDKLSSLEAIVKYLKEHKAMKISRIALILNRDNRTIWATYANTLKKMPEPLRVEEGQSIPITTIANRKLSVLEHIVSILKQRGHSNHHIALLLHLDDRTIWSVWHRAKQKRGVQ